MSEPAWYDRIEAATGQRPERHSPLAGGSIAEVNKAAMPDGTLVVVKVGEPGAGFPLEARMLQYLAAHSDLPVPAVVAADEHVLVMTYIAAGGRLDARAQTHAADLLAALHNMTAAAYGLDFDTVIGGIPQPNGWRDAWVDFFRDRRLTYMADLCLESADITAEERGRIDRLAEKLADIIGPAAAPGLIHGDMWGGNVLVRESRIAGFVDPAIYYADPEIELAFSTLFHTFANPFFERYAEHRPIRPGFFEERRDLYNLWHLLNHVYLFGRGYWSGVARTLAKFGC